MTFVEDDDVIETLPANATNEALGIGNLPRAPRCGRAFLHPRTAHAFSKLASIDSITIAQQVFRRGLPWKRFNELLRRPFARRTFRHIEVNDPAPIVGKDDQHEQHSQSRRGYGEEVNRHDVPDVLLQERGPRRRSRPAQLRSILLHRRLRNINPELLKFAHNTRRAPGRICLPHLSNVAP